MKISKAVLKAITLSSVLVLGGTYASAAEQNQANPSEATTPLQGNLGLSENGGYDPNPPSDLNEKQESKIAILVFLMCLEPLILGSPNCKIA